MIKLTVLLIASFHAMACSPFALLFVSLFTAVVSHCPPSKGIYLKHRDYCIPEYAEISGKALTADNPLHCVLADGTGEGQWMTASGNATVCGELDSMYPLTCSQYSNNITLYETDTPFTRNQVYTCTISAQSISVQIRNNTVLSAIYIESPADVRSVPQNYTIHCITTEEMTRSEVITVEAFLESKTNAVSYTPILSDSVLLSQIHNTKICDYYTKVSWSADKVETTATAFGDHGLTKYNGDLDWICGIEGKKEFLQSYIKVPNSSASSLDVCGINEITVNICWSPVNATEADGYVVYYETTSGTANATDVGNNTQYTVGELDREVTYIFTVRAYQDLLGIASAPLTIVLGKSTIAVNGTVIAGIVNMTWSLLHRYTSNMEVRYHIDCITMNTSNEQLNWTKNGSSLVNSTSNLQTSLENTNVITITTMEYESVEIACSNQLFSRSIVVEAPSGPPLNVQAVFQSLTSIAVSWSPPVGGADGYIVLYSAEGASNKTKPVENQTSSLLTGLSEGHLYTISVLAYKNLNSQPSHPMKAVMLDISDFLLVSLIVGGTDVALSVSLGNITALNDNVTNTTGVLGYTLSLSSNSCPQLKVAYTESKNVTSLNNTLLVTQPLHPGLMYNITVAVNTPIGSANYSVTDYASYQSVPEVAPLLFDATAINSSAVSVNWKAVACYVSNGEIIQYQIRLTSSTGTSGVALVSGKKTSHVITGLERFTRYDISVAAVTASGAGPYSHIVSVTTLYNEYISKPLKWALLSDRTSPQVVYQVNCTTERLDGNWIKNGIFVVANSSTVTLSRHVVNDMTEVIVNTMTVTELDYISQTITCSTTYGGNTFSDTVTIHGSAETPKNVRAEIFNLSSILVSWSMSKSVSGYVISYSADEGGSFMQLVNKGAYSSVIAKLIKGNTYNITVFSYNDLPSPPSQLVMIKLDVPDQISVKSLPSTNVLTLALNSDSSVQYTNCTISYYSNSCLDKSTTSVTIPAEQAHYSMTLLSGQTYSINVTATNPIGTSSPVSLNYSVPVYKTPASPPLNVSQAVVNLTALNITWSGAQCLDGSASYVVVYTGAAGTVNTISVPSTETSVLITNLIPHSQYSIRVAARNEIGIGPFSDPILTSTTTGPIHSLICATVNQTSITLVWSRKHYSYNSTNSLVRVSYTAMTDCSIVTSAAPDTRDTSQNYAVIVGLTPQTCYQFNVSLTAGNSTEGAVILCQTADNSVPIAYVASIGLLGTGMGFTFIIILVTVAIVAIRSYRKKRQNWKLLQTAPHKLSRSPVAEMKESMIYERFGRGNAIYDSIRYTTRGGGKNDDKTANTPHEYDNVQVEKSEKTEETSSL